MTNSLARLLEWLKSLERSRTGLSADLVNRNSSVNRWRRFASKFAQHLAYAVDDDPGLARAEKVPYLDDAAINYRNAMAAARWPWNQLRPERCARSASESRRPAARLNQRPKFCTVSIQASTLTPSRSRIGAK